MSRKNKVKTEDEMMYSDEMRLEAKYSSYNKRSSNKNQVKDAKGTFRRFILLLKPYSVSVIFVLICSIGVTLVDVVSPDFMANVIDTLQTSIENFANNGTPISFGSVAQKGTVWYELFLIGLLYVGQSILTFLQQFVGAGISQKLVFNLRKDANEKLSRVPLSYFDNNTKGEIISKVVNDIDNVSGSLQSTFISVITAAIKVVGSLYMMLRTGNFVMTLVAIILVPVSGLLSYKVSRISKKWFKKYWASMGALTGHVEEMFTGHNIVRIFNHEKQSIKEFKEINYNLKHNSFVANMISGILNPVLTLISNVNYVLLCIFGGCYYIGTWFLSGRKIPVGNRMGLGSIQAFLSYSSNFSSPILSISSMINSIQSSLASAERVFALLDEKEMSKDDTTNDNKENLNSEVKFENVSFRYLPDKPLIENFNLTAEPGETVAIVGPTGAGKTTIVNLLMRFYEVDSGAILLDGVDIRTMSRDKLRENFGMVLQDTWLFKGTIKENISYGCDGATDEQIIEAAKVANIHDYIMTMKKGYDTEITEDGTNLSQGQRQLITIARAVLRNPKVLILDEATSSVDTRTEILIQEAMDKLMENRTAFVIAHRLTTIKNADKIIVMRKGRIVETGNHESLMKENGFYASLYNSQYTGGIPEDAE
jgi:ATP-binding cassette subfamily B protein